MISNLVSFAQARQFCHTCVPSRVPPEGCGRADFEMAWHLASIASELATGECAQTLGHTRFSPAGAKLVSASTDETARSRDVAMGGCQHTGGRQQTQEGHTDTATTPDCTKLPSRRLPAAGGVRRAGLGAGRSASRRCPPPAARAPSRHDRTLGLKSIGNSSLEIVNLDWDSLPFTLRMN